jgi:hypothetical protein
MGPRIGHCFNLVLIALDFGWNKNNTRLSDPVLLTGNCRVSSYSPIDAGCSSRLRYPYRIMPMAAANAVAG